MTVYIRTPYGHFPRPHDMHRFGRWPFEGSDVFFPINVKVEATQFIITALLPGLKADDVAIQITDEEVSLKGEFKQQTDEKDDCIMQEIPAGKFSRTILLPDALDANKATAEMKEGILTLKVPKSEAVKPKTIKVDVK